MLCTRSPSVKSGVLSLPCFLWQLAWELGFIISLSILRPINLHKMDFFFTYTWDCVTKQWQAITNGGKVFFSHPSSHSKLCLSMLALNSWVQDNHAKLERILLGGLRLCLEEELISFTQPTDSIRKSQNTCPARSSGFVVEAANIKTDVMGVSLFFREKHLCILK